MKARLLRLPCLPAQRNADLTSSQLVCRVSSISSPLRLASRQSGIRSRSYGIDVTEKVLMLASFQTRSSSSSATKSLNSTWLREVLDQNVRWATDVTRTRPELLPTLSKGQSPKILWIGCADSRVPETTVLGLQPGDVFVHRNIANIVNPTDLSALSVIEYAVRYLKVEHIILCGHTSCGGVAAALGNQSLGKIDTWLMPLRQLRLEHHEKLSSAESEEQRGKMLVEANVRKGVQVLRQLPEVIDAVKEGRLDITGVVYDLKQGQLKPLEEEEGAKNDETVKSAFGLS